MYIKQIQLPQFYYFLSLSHCIFVDVHYYLHNFKSIYSSLEFTDQNLFFYHFYEDLISAYKNTILNKKKNLL